jgi:hypothetical protein
MTRLTAALVRHIFVKYEGLTVCVGLLLSMAVLASADGIWMAKHPRETLKTAEECSRHQDDSGIMAFVCAYTPTVEVARRMLEGRK